jgi:hypothetical protein
VDAILNLERPAPQHLRWPDLDVDLAVDSIAHPEHYPLKVKALIYPLLPWEPLGGNAVQGLSDLEGRPR